MIHVILELHNERIKDSPVKGEKFWIHIQTNNKNNPSLQPKYH